MYQDICGSSPFNSDISRSFNIIDHDPIPKEDDQGRKRVEGFKMTFEGVIKKGVLMTSNLQYNSKLIQSHRMDKLCSSSTRWSSCFPSWQVSILLYFSSLRFLVDIDNLLSVLLFSAKAICELSWQVVVLQQLWLRSRHPLSGVYQCYQEYRMIWMFNIFILSKCMFLSVSCFAYHISVLPCPTEYTHWPYE
jgi:hypothetical protein